MHFSGELAKLIGHATKIILVHQGLELDDHWVLIAQIIAASDESF